MHDVLRSPGQPLDPAARAFFEPRFGHDFGQVRVHTDAKAADSALAVDALAYTVGRDLVFGAGRYAPETAAGRRLLAHELTHSVQQDGAESNHSSIVLGEKNSASESEAAHAGHAIATGSSSSSVARRVPPTVQGDFRDDDDPMHKPVIEEYRRKRRLPVSGVDEFGNPVGPTTAEIKYGQPAKAVALAEELEKLIDNATWKEIRKRVYPKESAAGIKRAKERKAGTLADLTGLGQIKTLEHFATAVKAIQKKWATLKPDDRVNELGNAANAELAAVDVPGFLIVGKIPMQSKGFFDSSLWRFVISQELVTNNTISDDEAADVTNTTMHESRHAEEQFLAARFSAGVNSKDADGLVAEQKIPKVIAQKAVAKKFDAQTNKAVAELGKKMFQAHVTDKEANVKISQDTGWADLDVKRAAAEAALRNLTAFPHSRAIAEATAKRDELKAQILVVEQKYTLYRNIPYEADAHEVGDAAEEAFKGWPP
ncbi:MAG TPA: DUF4157 domain-containing protein [Candidatus Binatia bacterium]